MGFFFVVGIQSCVDSCELFTDITPVPVTLPSRIWVQSGGHYIDVILSAKTSKLRDTDLCEVNPPVIQK